MQYMNIVFVCNEELKRACKAIQFVYLATNLSSNCSRSDVNMRAQPLRKNYSRNLSSIQSGPMLLASLSERFFQTLYQFANEL